MTETHIRKVLEGDHDAFRHIIRRYKDNAYSLAMSVLKNGPDARDAVQNAFIRAYTRLDTFEGRSAFGTWFYRIVVNEAYQVKHRQKSKPVESYNGQAPPGEIRSTTETNSEKDHRRYYINEALRRMPADYSLALRLHYLEDYSVKEMTRITGWTASNAKVLLHRARKRMKELLTNEFKINKEELY